MRILILYFLLACTVNPARSLAGDSLCYQDHLVIQREIKANLSYPLRLSQRLPTYNRNGNFLTNARIKLETSYSSWTQWDATFSFDFPHQSGVVSLPYNVYAVALEVRDPKGAYTYFQDFTENCSGPGLGIFPGGHYRSEKMRLPRRPIFNPWIQLHLRVWGHL